MQRVKVNEKSFEGKTIYVGIDCHLKNWKVCVLGEEYEYKSMSCNPDAKALASYLSHTYPGGNYKAVYEAGFSGFEACRQLRELGVRCKVVHPADVPTSQRDRHQKTDKVDSRKLAKMLRSGDYEALHVPDIELEADRALVRQRFRIMSDVSRIKHRVKSLLYEFGVKIPERFSEGQTRSWSKKFREWLVELPGEREDVRLVVSGYVDTGVQLKKQLIGLNKQVRKLAQKERYRKNYEILNTIPGVGPLISILFLVQIGDISRFNRLDELCAYLGFIPRMHGSGDRMVIGKLSGRGRKELKKMLIEAAWTASRKDPALILRFNELRKRMNKNKAIIRIVKNLVGRMRYLLKSGEEYELGVIK